MLPVGIPIELGPDYEADGPGMAVKRNGERVCALNGGSHQCAFVVLEKGLTIPRQCRRKTALVGVDMDFYRCADPQGRTSRLIDECHAQGTLPNVEGRQYFCYLHLTYLFGVVPRKTDGKGLGLRAVAPLPQWALVGCFAMMPIPPEELPPDRRDRYLTQWTTDPANPTNMRRTGDPNEPAPLAPPRGGQPILSIMFDDTCWRDLADFANDGRLLTEGGARAAAYPRLCAGSNAQQLVPPPGAVPPVEQLPVNPGLTTAQRTALLTTGVDSRAGLMRNFRPPVPLPPGIPGSLRSIYCWQPELSSTVNSAVRRVRFRYFPPTWPRPAGGVDPGWLAVHGREWLERIALYTLVAVPGRPGKTTGIDLEVDRSNVFHALQYCAGTGVSSKECVSLKLVKGQRRKK